MKLKATEVPEIVTEVSGKTMSSELIEGNLINGNEVGSLPKIK
jgi:hypothetical protein